MIFFMNLWNTYPNTYKIPPINKSISHLIERKHVFFKTSIKNTRISDTRTI